MGGGPSKNSKIKTKKNIKQNLLAEPPKEDIPQAAHESEPPKPIEEKAKPTEEKPKPPKYYFPTDNGKVKIITATYYAYFDQQAKKIILNNAQTNVTYILDWQKQGEDYALNLKGPANSIDFNTKDTLSGQAKEYALT